MSFRKLHVVIVAALFAVSCAESTESGDREILDAPAEPNQDALPGGLFHDFVADGKWDAAGHPQGAEVFEGVERCAPTTGVAGKRGIAADSGLDGPGVLCAAETLSLGDGTFTLNARALIEEGKTNAGPDEPILEIAVVDDGAEVETRAVTLADFTQNGTETDLAVTFRHRGDGSVNFEVRWTGAQTVRLSYVEIFRSTPRLVVSPASSVLGGGEDLLEIELQDPPDDLTFEIACDDVDLTPTLDALVESGEATWEDTEFRTLLTAPVDTLLEGCASPTKIRVNALSGGWARETSRVTYYSEPIPCAYRQEGEGSDPVRVLLTGFEPFPADSDRDNSSKEAVSAYVEGPLPQNVAVMTAILPVEYDSAPALLGDMVARCAPDIVVGFGQGRSAVDLEQTAYNRKDTASIAGGVPDNRGVVYGGAPIVEGGPSELYTELPVDEILAGLDALGIRGGPSTDPGRYVCNNTFYGIIDAVGDSDATGGFVHLPRIPRVDETERETLRQTVATVVDATLAQRSSR